MPKSYINFDSGNGLVASGIIWAKVKPDQCPHMALLGHYKITKI